MWLTATMRAHRKLDDEKMFLQLIGITVEHRKRICKSLRANEITWAFSGDFFYSTVLFVHNHFINTSTIRSDLCKNNEVCVSCVRVIDFVSKIVWIFCRFRWHNCRKWNCNGQYRLVCTTIFGTAATNNSFTFDG